MRFSRQICHAFHYVDLILLKARQVKYLLLIPYLQTSGLASWVWGRYSCTGPHTPKHHSAWDTCCLFTVLNLWRMLSLSLLWDNGACPRGLAIWLTHGPIHLPSAHVVYPGYVLKSFLPTPWCPRTCLAFPSLSLPLDFCYPPPLTFTWKHMEGRRSLGSAINTNSFQRSGYRYEDGRGPDLYVPWHLKKEGTGISALGWWCHPVFDEQLWPCCLLLNHVLTEQVLAWRLQFLGGHPSTENWGGGLLEGEMDFTALSLMAGRRGDLAAGGSYACVCMWSDPVRVCTCPVSISTSNAAEHWMQEEKTLPNATDRYWVLYC